jgi:hypothetical protein
MSVLGTHDTKLSTDHLFAVLLDPKKPVQVRAHLLLDVLSSDHGDPAHLHKLLTGLLERAGKQGDSPEVAKLKAKYEQALSELENGPARPAAFIGEADGSMPGPKPRLHVVTPDGQARFPVPHKDIKLADLKPGMTVFLDPKGAVALGASPAVPQVGHEAEFIRRLPGSDALEVKYRDELLSVYGSQLLLDADVAGELRRGDRVLFSLQQQFAFRRMPAESNRRHRFVDDSKMPDVIASRDIGNPHWILGWMLRRLRVLLFNPGLVDRFHLRRRCAVAMEGPSGSGKTLTIKAFLTEFRKLLVQFTGRTDLGSRVIRAKTSDLLSPFFGQSDINIEAFFTDLRFIASQEVETGSGQRVLLPIVVLIEEAEGFGRRRGEFDGGIYDRIIGMLLQRLDDPTDDLSELPIFFICTTNRPDMMDAAMWRRLAGIRARFTRLDRLGLAAVLDKKLRADFAYAPQNGTPPEQLRINLINQVVASLFSPNGDDRGQVEITFRDGKKAIKHRRDFLTGAVIEQAVANAIDGIVFAVDEGGDPEIGLSPAGLMDSLRNVIDGLADNLTAGNAADYVDLPDQSPVATVRRLREPNGRSAHFAV